MHKVAFWLAILIAILGLLLFIPFSALRGQLYEIILFVHILLGFVLIGILIKFIYTHVSEQLSNPFKSGIKKWNGFKTFLYLILSIISGLIIIVFKIKWLIYFHGFIGLWALLVGWKHKRT